MFLPDALYSWQSVNTSNIQPILLGNHLAYQCEGSPSDPPIVFKLPTSSLKGFNCKIVGLNRFFKVIQNANQYCYQGPSQSTIGATGYIQATTANDYLQIQCMLANQIYCVHSTQGTILFN